MIVGFIFLVIGVLALLEVVIPDFILNYNVVWPSVLIAVSFYWILKVKKVETSNIIVFFVGVWFLLVNIDVIYGTLLNMFWPIMLIVAGISIMVNAATWMKKAKAGLFTPGEDGYLNFHGVFGGSNEKVKVKDFAGANIYSVFGGSEIDFSEIEFKKDSAVLNVYSVFGGSEIWVPSNVNIVVNSTGIFGGNDNKTKNETKKGQKTLYINAISVFGGCEIK